jgi:hypothetical protein
MSGNRDDLDGSHSDEDSNDEDYVPTIDKHESASSQSDDETADEIDRNTSKRYLSSTILQQSNNFCFIYIQTDKNVKESRLSERCKSAKRRRSC